MRQPQKKKLNASRELFFGYLVLTHIIHFDFIELHFDKLAVLHFYISFHAQSSDCFENHCANKTDVQMYKFD